MKHQAIIPAPHEELSARRQELSTQRLLAVVVGFSRKLNTQPEDESWIIEMKSALNEMGAIVRHCELLVADRLLPQSAKSGDVLVGQNFTADIAGINLSSGISDSMKIVLDNGSQLQTAINIELEARFPAHILDQISDLASALSQLWIDRSGENTRREGTILSTENPFGLTGSETRVCYALKEGMSPAKIAAQLEIGIATVRTHLSNIYAKTGLPSQTAVVRQLSIERSIEWRSAP